MDDSSFLEDFMHRYKRVLLPLVVSICIFGIVANCINILVLTRKTMISQRINIILTGLAVAQLLLLINFICYTVYTQLDSECSIAFKSFAWLSYLLFNVNLNLVVHTIALVHTSVLAAVRYVIVHFPTKNVMTPFRVKTLVAVIWLLVPLLCFPFYANSHVGVYTANETCVNWSSNATAYMLKYSSRRWLLVFNFYLFAIVGKLLPCLCLTVLSLLLVRDMKRARDRRMQMRGGGVTVDGASGAVSARSGAGSTRSGAGTGRETGSVRQREETQRRDRQHWQVTAMLVTIVCLFTAVELPQGILNMLQALASQRIIFHDFNYTKRVYLPLGEVFEILTVLYSSINFVLYCVMSGQFRLTFLSICRSIGLSCPKRNPKSTAANDITLADMKATGMDETKALLSPKRLSRNQGSDRTKRHSIK